MDKGDFESLQRARAQVASYQAGERDGFVVHEPVDVKALRKRMAMTQVQFAQTYHLPVGTLRDWEQARRQPDAPARALLTIIERDPVAAEKLLAGA